MCTTTWSKLQNQSLQVVKSIQHEHAVLGTWYQKPRYSYDHQWPLTHTRLTLMKSSWYQLPSKDDHPVCICTSSVKHHWFLSTCHYMYMVVLFSEFPPFMLASFPGCVGGDKVVLYWLLACAWLFPGYNCKVHAVSPHRSYLDKMFKV